jgi:hypothetical protein
MLDWAVLPNLVPILVAAGLIAAALRIEPGDRHRVIELAWPLAVAAIVLACWIFVQTLPLPISNAPPLSWLSELVHPVWQSAAEALQKAIPGRITVDAGVTIVALVRVVSLVGLGFLAMAVTLDRERAEAVLVGLTIATTLLAAVVIYMDLLHVGGFAARDEALDAACLGLVLSAACGTLAYERSKRRRRERDRARFGIVAILAVVAFVASLLAILVAGSGPLLFAAASGLVTFASVVVVRRLGLGRWGAVVIGATGLVIFVTLVVRAAGPNPDPRLAFVVANSASLDLTRRISADAPVIGTGAGTYSSLVQIYRPSDMSTASLEAVTAAAKVSIELGRPVLWLLVGVTVITALWLLRGALRRGRDYVYPAAGAASLVMLAILAFVNVGLFGSAIALLAAPVLGLALAQAKGSGSSA